jgi:thioredoxin-dependent peroxiredoxin
MMQVSYTTPEGQQVHADFLSLLSTHNYTILYFYPKDNTSWCTIQANDFSALVDQYIQQDIQIIGVSKDSHSSHCKFIEKQNIKYTLISDEDLSLHKHFGTLGEKSMYGKKYIGTIRSTFLLDLSAKIRKERRNVSAKGHAQEVLNYIKNLN